MDEQNYELFARAQNGGRFRTTHWSLVLRAAGEDESLSRNAMESLCRTYWPAVYAFIRGKGHSPADAEDLTQGFFFKFLEKGWLDSVDAGRGRFRSFLLTMVARFLSNERERSEAAKRGGGQAFLSFNAEELEANWVAEPSDPRTAEAAFERRWAEALLNRVLQRLKEEFDGGGRSGRFDALKGYLTDDRGETPYSEVAQRLGLTESAVKSGIHRLRQRYAELVRDEISQTVESPDQIDAEIRHLLDHLSGA